MKIKLKLPCKYNGAIQKLTAKNYVKTQQI